MPPALSRSLWVCLLSLWWIWSSAKAIPTDYSTFDQYQDGPLTVRATIENSRDRSLLYAVDQTTGKVKWLQVLFGRPTLNPLGSGQGVVLVTGISSGAQMVGASYIFDLNTGKRLLAGGWAWNPDLPNFGVLGLRDGAALLSFGGGDRYITEGDPDYPKPQDVPVTLYRLSDGKTLWDGLKVLPRPGCGGLAFGGAGIYSARAQGPYLLIPRQDECGTFEALFEWFRVPPPPPRLLPRSTKPDY